MDTQTISGLGMTYDVLREDDLPGAIECVTATFAKGDPVSVAVNLTPDDLRSFIDIFLTKRLVSDGLSVVARESESGNISGCLLMTDLIMDEPEGMDRLPRNIFPVLALLDTLDGKYIEEHKVTPGQVLHVLMAGVAQGHKNLGIGFQMLIKGYEIAKARRYKRAIAEITGAASQHVAAKYGAKTLYEQSYQDFEFEGGYPFRSITECTSCKLMYIDL